MLKKDIILFLFVFVGKLLHLNVFKKIILSIYNFFNTIWMPIWSFFFFFFFFTLVPSSLKSWICPCH